MPKLYNPDTQQTVDVAGQAVQQHKDQGYVVVGNRPAEEYEGKSREELTDAEDTEALEPETSAEGST